MGFRFHNIAYVRKRHYCCSQSAPINLHVITIGIENKPFKELNGDVIYAVTCLAKIEIEHCIWIGGMFLNFIHFNISK